MDFRNYTNQARLNYIDIYKGILIIFVIFTHYSWDKPQRMFLLFPFWIDMAVPMFLSITGYLSSLLFQKKGWTLKDAYHPKEIISKLLRFIIPYSIVYIIQIILLNFQRKVSLIEYIKTYLRGGLGPGSYYSPIMIQVIILIPLILFIILKLKTKGLIICFCANVIFEITKFIFDLPVDIYRICSFRYIFILGYGCYLFVSQDKKRIEWWQYLFGIVGILYLIVFKYTSATPIIIPNEWISTSVFGVLYILPVMKVLLKPNSWCCFPIEIVGKASFNVYLVQMVYYWCVADYVYNIVHLSYLRILINILVCCVVGVFFYLIERPITKSVINFLGLRKR